MSKIDATANAALDAWRFVTSSHLRAGRPHPVEGTETALVERDKTFVTAYVEYAKTSDEAPDFFWYYVFTK